MTPYLLLALALSTLIGGCVTLFPTVGGACEILDPQPGHDRLRLSLGLVRFLRGIERVGQSLHRYGLRSEIGQKLGIPILRLPVPANAAPESITYDNSRRILQEWIDDLKRAEATLADIRDEDVKLSIPFGLVRLDLDGDGEASEAERLLTVYSQLNRGVAGMLRQSHEFRVSLDAADVHWLRGYCHLLMGMAEFVLAYDQKEQFERTAQLFFPKVESPYSFLDTRGDEAEIVDLVAGIHMLRWPLREPSRLQDALGHLRTMVAESRESWRLILDEGMTTTSGSRALDRTELCQTSRSRKTWSISGGCFSRRRTGSWRAGSCWVTGASATGAGST